MVRNPEGGDTRGRSNTFDLDVQQICTSMPMRHQKGKRARPGTQAGAQRRRQVWSFGSGAATVGFTYKGKKGNRVSREEVLAGPRRNARAKRAD